MKNRKSQSQKVRKKDKEEKKKDEKPKKEKKEGKSKKEKGSKSSDKPPVPEKKMTADKDEGFSEDRGYIDRRMVESVLSFQKLQRSGSCVSHTSTSSIESDGYNRGRGITPKDNLSSEIPFDSASLDSHKDSGYASSDRNSSSSTGSITMNPYEQYFLSRNMIPPKTINHQAMAENMRKLMDEGPGVSGLQYTQEKDLKSLVTNPNEFYHQNSIVGHASQVTNSNLVSMSQKDQPVGPHIGQSFVPNPIPMGHHPPKDLMTLPKAERDQHLFDALSGRSKGFNGPQNPQVGSQPSGPYRGPAMNQNRPNEQGMPQAQNVHRPDFPPRHNEASFPQPIPEGIPLGSEQFISLCQRAEDIMDSCILAETSEQYSNASGYCQQAIDLLKQGMRLPNLDQTSYEYAQRKSNACVIKLRSLHKRLNMRQESGNSAANGENGNIDYRGRQHKQQNLHLLASNSGGRPPSRSGSQNSMDSLGSNRSVTPVFDKGLRPSTDSRVPPVEPHMPPIQGSPYKDRSFETNVPDSNSSSNADLYGTLPRRKTQKSQDHNRQCSNQKHEAEVYQDYLESQRRQSDGVSHSRTSSGARTPVNELNSDLIDEQNGRYDSNNSNMYHQHPVQNVKNSQSVNVRSHIDSSSGFTYSRMSQGLKPIPVAPPKIEKQNKHTESQPDLRKLTGDNSISSSIPQRPLTPSVLCSEENGDQSQISVRDLKSRFESARISDSKPEQLSDARNRVQGFPGSTNDTGNQPQVSRQRSKSESRVQESQNPKSVLSKKGKNGNKLNKPRKSVTFSTDVCLVEAAGDWELGNGDHVMFAGCHGDSEGQSSHVTRPVRDNMGDNYDSSASNSPVEVIGDRACTLCHKQGVEQGQSYCSKCMYYMSKFEPS